MPRPPISAQLYSVRDAIADDLAGSLERLAALGFGAVEPFGFTDRAQEYASALAAAGLTAPSGHAPVLRHGDPRPLFDAAARLGMHTLIDPHHPAEHWQDPAAVSRTAERMNALAETAAGFGLRFGYHNHAFELSTRHAGTTALELLARDLSPRVVLEVDTYWAEVGGVSAPGLLGRLGPRVTLIHVKDGPLSGDTAAQVPAGKGEVDVDAVLAAAPGAGRVLEFDHHPDPFAGLAESLAYVEGRDA
ncbi:sugar phosphate isomerase/epimerase family protein [Nocardiopsis baichengensis]|uniref:sugar phosphate isomerase/epimerase family protein n=1 Tax=Nocardiopsis baichengensis TaxID=280240 RepID=UPI00034527E5|nr:sugar phosphate isomerase/epimerase [Nocardiopsis baichengensis]